MPATFSLAMSPESAAKAMRQSSMPMGTNKKRRPRLTAASILASLPAPT